MDRIAKERDFHDQRFRDHDEDVRAGLGKYYSVYTLNTALYNALLGAYLPGRDALEYGCAKGEKSLRWAGHGARISGIDISEEIPGTRPSADLAAEPDARMRLRAWLLEAERR